MTSPPGTADLKSVLVTGATRGLGLAIARRLVDDGYRVVGAGRKTTDELKALCDQDPQRAVYEQLDLADQASLPAFMQRVAKLYGPLYGLVNNAAAARDGVLATLHERDITDTIAVNVTGTILLTKHAVRSMLVGRQGRIVNVSSIVSSTGFNGLSVYAATKSAMIGFTKSLARELGRANITVNALAPGYMETDMSSGLNEDQLDSIRRRSPMRKLITVDDAAGSVAFLLGPDAGMITGTTLTVDGGSTA